MKNTFKNPVMVNLEISLIEDILRVIGSAIHNKFTHDEISSIKNLLISKGQQAIAEEQKKLENQEGKI